MGVCLLAWSFAATGGHTGLTTTILAADVLALLVAGERSGNSNSLLAWSFAATGGHTGLTTTILAADALALLITG